MELNIIKNATKTVRFKTGRRKEGTHTHIITSKAKILIDTLIN